MTEDELLAPMVRVAQRALDSAKALHQINKAGVTEMTNRELLERAAKAAGYTGRWFGEDYCTLRDEKIGLHMPWNPLNDDGDAFRLAVKLRLIVDTTEAIVVTYFLQGCEYSLTEWECADREAATRRAIVRAAAALTEPAHG